MPARHSPRSSRRRALVTAGVLFAGGTLSLRRPRAEGQARTVAMTLMRALGYDVNLKARGSAFLVLAVLYRPSVSASRREREEFAAVFKELEAATVQGLPFRVTSIAVTDAAALEEAARGGDVAVFYVCAGLEDEVPLIKQVSRKLLVRTAGGKESLVDKGISIAVDADAKPSLIVNLKESREEGAAFSSALLRLAKVIK